MELTKLQRDEIQQKIKDLEAGLENLNLSVAATRGGIQVLREMLEPTTAIESEQPPAPEASS